MYIRAFAPVFALLAATSARPHCKAVYNSTPSSTSAVPSSSSDVSSWTSPAATTAVRVPSSTEAPSSHVDISTSSSHYAPLPPSTPASTPTSSPTSTPSSTPSSTSSPPIPTQAAPAVSSKRGVVANPIPKVVGPLGAYEKLSWDLNWWTGAPPEQPDNWQFIPQLTHPSPDQYWGAASFQHNSSGFPYIASFLEPEGNDVSIEEAVQSWKTNLEPLTSSHTVLPPMVGQEGLPWLQNFTAACTGCTFNDAPIAFTIYCSPDDGGVADFKNHLEQFKAAFPGRELWAANIGPLGTSSNDTVVEWLMRQLVPYLENEPAVTRYAWNGAQYFWDDATDSLTPLAHLYATM